MPRFLRITYVEDNPNDVLLLETFLNESNMRCLLNVIEDGESAIEYVSRLARQDELMPDLFFLDLNLPRRNGYEVLEAIRKCRALDQMQVIILTTSDNPEDKIRALKSGANCFLTKPPEFENLQMTLEVIETAWLNIAFVAAQVDSNGTSTESASTAVDLGADKAIRSLLLIEDNPHDVLYIQETLDFSPGPLDISTVETVGEALKILATQTFSVILADLNLPDATGLEVLEKLTRSGTEVPIVILTGLDDELIGMRAVEKGAQDYLVKGNFDKISLRRSIKYAVTRGRAAAMARQEITSHGAVLQELLENSPVGLAHFGKDLKLTNCNLEFRNALSLEAFGEERSPTMSEIFEDVPEQSWLDAINFGIPFTSEQVKFANKKDDSKFWLGVWSVRDRLNAITGGVLMAIEVTDQLIRESRRDEFFAALAHDIKNPLVGSNSVLNAVMSGALGHLEPRQKQTLALLKDSNDNLLSMLRNLIDVYRFASNTALNEFTKVNFAEAIADAIATHAPLAMSKNVKIELVLPSQQCFILGDTEALHRLCSNLLDNAIKFSHADATVVVELAITDAGLTSLKVIDQGVGMTVEEQSYMFTRPTGVRRPVKPGSGTGLGLYLCKKVTDGHQGSITCKSEVEQGTTFEVLLPSLVPSPCA